MFVPFAVFGPGSLYVRRTDIAGSTPINIGYAQEFSIEESAENKELFGQKQYPLVVARGTIKVTGKIKAAMISPLALNNAYYGESGFTTGGNAMAQGEEKTPVTTVGVTELTTVDNVGTAVFTVASSAGFTAGMRVTGHSSIPEGSYVISTTGTTITINQVVVGTTPTGTTLTAHPGVIVTNGANFVQDLGVLYSSSGQPLEKQTSPAALTTGQYAVSATGGAYFFADTEHSIAFLITYAYTSTEGDTLTITNKDIGNTPTFELWYATSLNAKPYTVHVFQAVSAKLSQQFKLTDFMMPELDFGIFANPAGKVYEAHYPE